MLIFYIITRFRIVIKMKYVTVYWSRYGHGKKIVEYLDEKLKNKGGETKIFKTAEADPNSLPEADMYIFSAPTEAFSVQRDMKDFMKKLQVMNGKKYAIINTHAMKKSKLGSMEKILSKKNMEKVADIDFRVEGDFKTGSGLPDNWKEKIDDFSGKL